MRNEYYSPSNLSASSKFHTSYSLRKIPTLCLEDSDCLDPLALSIRMLERDIKAVFDSSVNTSLNVQYMEMTGLRHSRA